MKRPMAIVGLTYLAALVAATYFGITISKILSIIFFVLFILTFLFKFTRSRKVLPIAFITASIACILYILANYLIIDPLKILDNQDVNISGKICEIPYKSYGRYYYIIETDKIEFDGAKQNIKIRVSMSKALDADLYDRVTGKIHIFFPSEDSNFSANTYYASKGIHIFSYLYEYENYSIEQNLEKPIYYYFLKFRQLLINSIRSIFPEEIASIAVGVSLGDKFLLNDDIKSNFSTVGVSHLLAVSGLHVSIVASALYFLLNKTRLSKKIVYILTCLSILIFMALVGFTASVVRAGIMLIMIYIAKLFYVNADSLNSLGVAVFILTIINPFAAGNLGLLLSVSATLGIILFNKIVKNDICLLFFKQKIKSKLINNIIDAVSVSLSANLFTLPIIMLSFGKISFVSTISNILVTLPTMFMMIFVLISSILYLIGPIKFLAYPFAFISGIIAKYIILCVNFLAKIPFAAISTRQPMILYWLASTCLLIAIALIFCNKFEFFRLSLILSVIILFTGTLSLQILDKNITHLAFLDTGNGCSAILTKNGHCAALSCGGDDIKYTKLQSYLEAKNIKYLDCALLGDFEDTTANFANEIIKKFSPYYVVLSNEETIDDKLERNILDNSNVVYFNTSVEINLWDNVKITVNKINKKSYIYLKINDITVLMNSDGGDAHNLPNNFKNCDILSTIGNFDNLDDITCTYVVINSNLDTSSKFANVVSKSKKFPLATAGDGNIVADFSGRRNIVLKREK